ncbi:LacI family DNA-binding transcriptional regulator [Protaetiibacter intestinalis]|uniref:LacI family transcriptional regulator n=1 Tax=Protaetiibacter intestinalis TaxID=2419774 RepID=A0A387B8P0_9MICO|nr:LacI family DNA-binding transcriptional regulator [Protaetiibacter intestinalis]AYF98191.1 LacI family transcriptional regulator [Protaetiibacter intestinalis]
MARTAAAERVTLARVAEEAGVSLSTISKVLNGRPDVSQATRSRVESLLSKHGYLRRKSSQLSTGLIELVFHELEAAWSMEIIRGVENIAADHGMSIVLTESGSRHAPDPDWIEGVLRRRPVGVVLVFSDLPTEYREALRSRAIPFVIIDPAGDPSPEVPSVGSANWSGGLMATRHLIELGHTKIAAITGADDMMCSHARIDGFRSAMSSAGLPIRPEWIRFGDFHTSGGYEHARSLLSGDDRPTAIFAGSDLQALGVLEAVRELGLRVPDDLSLVGYDDIPLAKWVSPRLTTIRQPLRRMAEEATRLVIRMSEAPLESVPRMDLATNLVLRESTAPLVA